jgi:hypothetical protein
MAEQFSHHTSGINLYPFGGDASIPYKWDIAKHLEECAALYGKPLHMLYFGDLDEKGQQIFFAAFEDIQEWCEYPIEASWCGLTEEHAERYKLPENPEKPGQYQWEALTDDAASEIIGTALDEYGIDKRLITKAAKQGKDATAHWTDKMQRALRRMCRDEERQSK